MADSPHRACGEFHSHPPPGVPSIPLPYFPVRRPAPGRSPRLDSRRTRWHDLLLLGNQLAHALHRLTNRPHVLNALVRNIDPELVLESKNDIDSVERIDLQLFKRAVE